MKTQFKITLLAGICLGLAVFSSCTRKNNDDDKHTPVPESYTTTYYVELTDSNGTTVYQGTSPEKTGTTFSVNNEKTQTSFFKIMPGETGSLSEITFRLLFDENKNLRPVGYGWKQNNVSEITIMINNTQGGTSRPNVATAHTLTDTTYYPYLVLSNNGMVTYRYDFSNVEMLSGDESYSFTASGYIICTAD